MTTGELAFVAFGLVSQTLLVGFFAVRRWRPSLGPRLGALAYAFGGLGLGVGLALLATGHSWKLFVGPLLMAGWAGFGATVDLWRPRPWRRPPIDWSVLGPYVGLYFFAQMFMWWPLWDFAVGAWVAFLILFVVNTALNIGGHFDDAESGRRT